MRRYIADVLGVENISKKWTMPIRNWSGAMNQFAIIYGD
jgi:transposase-like protein